MWFLYALIGAFGKSYSGFFRKKLAHNISAAMFMWFSYTVILIVLLPFVVAEREVVMNAFVEAPVILAGAGASMMIGTLMNLQALKREELSYIAPLNAFVPIFTLIIATIFLHESPPAAGMLGVLVIFFGAYVINLKPDRVRWYDPIVHLSKNAGARLSLVAAAAYALNTVLMKAASNRGYDEFTIMFAVTIVGWLLLGYVPLTKKTELKATVSASKVILLGAVLSSFAGSFFHILAIAGTYASYAVSIRRFDSVISVLLGWRYLKETNIPNKLIGSVILAIGATIMAAA